MATTPGIIPGISGYREDLRLEEKWWHRLAQVVYTVVAALVVAVVAFIVWKSATPAANLDNATVIASLADVVERSKNPQANAAAILAGMSGSLGLIGANREISYLSDYALRQSFCTSNAHLAVNQVAAFLNERDYTSVNTASNVRWSIPDGKPPIQLCWFGSGIQNVL